MAPSPSIILRHHTVSIYSCPVVMGMSSTTLATPPFAPLHPHRGAARPPRNPMQIACAHQVHIPWCTCRLRTSSVTVHARCSRPAPQPTTQTDTRPCHCKTRAGARHGPLQDTCRWKTRASCHQGRLQGAISPAYHAGSFSYAHHPCTSKKALGPQARLKPKSILHMSGTPW